MLHTSAVRGSEPPRGMVLLEVIVALTILAVSGSAIIALADASLRAFARAQAADDQVAQADAFLQAVSLWPREDLDRHLGNRMEGAWRMRIDRDSRTVYSVTIYDSTNDGALLHTSLFRAEQQP